MQLLGDKVRVVLDVPELRSQLGIDAVAMGILAQTMFWMPRCEDPEERVYKKDEEWAKELQCSEGRVRTAVARLRELGVLEFGKRQKAGSRNLTAVNEYRVDYQRLSELLGLDLNSGPPEGKEELAEEPECGEVPEIGTPEFSENATPEVAETTIPIYTETSSEKILKTTREAQGSARRKMDLKNAKPKATTHRLQPPLIETVPQNLRRLVGVLRWGGWEWALDYRPVRRDEWPRLSTDRVDQAIRAVAHLPAGKDRTYALANLLDVLCRSDPQPETLGPTEFLDFDPERLLVRTIRPVGHRRELAVIGIRPMTPEEVRTEAPGRRP